MLYRERVCGDWPRLAAWAAHAYLKFSSFSSAASARFSNSRQYSSTTFCSTSA
jgi:hypothetical protein